MTTFDPHLLDKLAQCYADAVVRRLLDDQEGDPGEPVLSSTSESLEQPAPDLAPGDFDEVPRLKYR